MRVTTVLMLTALAVLPAKAAYYVELTTGETMTVQSYWKDGEDVHLMRGGVDIIVKESRIKKLEAGAPEPVMETESATAKPDTNAEAPPPAAAAPVVEKYVPAERITDYKQRLSVMSDEDLKAEDDRASRELLDAQAARFQAKFAKNPSQEQVKELNKRFQDLQRRERAVNARLEELKIEQP